MVIGSAGAAAGLLMGAQVQSASAQLAAQPMSTIVPVQVAKQTSGPTCTGSGGSGSVVGMATTPDGNGYWIAFSSGAVYSCGDAAAGLAASSTYASGAALAANSPVSAITAAPSGQGYWLVNQIGQVASFGSAVSYGGVTTALNKPIVAMAADPATGGYWLLGGDGGVFSFDAPFYGSTGNIHLNAPAVGMAATTNGGGYYFVASDGGVFTYGNAAFHGSMGATPLNKPVVGMAVDPATGGYWLDAADGGIFSFDAPFYGSTGNIVLSEPCVGMTSMPSGDGYRFVAADGGIFDFGGAGFYGSAVGTSATGGQPSQAALQAVAFAKSKVGDPYLYGGTGVGGYDCSGLMQAAYASAGVSLPRTTQAQYGAFPLLASGAPLEPGDLVFFGSSPSNIGHDGIYIGGGNLIDSVQGYGVEIYPVSGYNDYQGASRPAP